MGEADTFLLSSCVFFTCASRPALSAMPLTSVRTQLGDLRSAPTSCGVVFDPVRGKRPDHERQAGDLGTVTAGSDGVADV